MNKHVKVLLLNIINTSIKVSTSNSFNLLVVIFSIARRWRFNRKQRKGKNLKQNNFEIMRQSTNYGLQPTNKWNVHIIFYKCPNRTCFSYPKNIFENYSAPTHTDGMGQRHTKQPRNKKYSTVALEFNRKA